MYVLFWDIDGTLLTTARAGVFALEEAAREVLGSEPDFSAMFTAGLTDSEVAALAIETLGGAASDETVEAFLRSYEHHLPDRLGWRAGSVMPGVVAILEATSSHPGTVNLLLTGNTPAGAEAKLRHYGLWDFFEAGAFCTAVEDRDSIARRAWDLARETLGAEPAPDQVFVIGDTPLDISCGHRIGARTVAVASGPHSLEELDECEPWLLLSALPPPDDFMRLLGIPAASEAPGR